MFATNIYSYKASAENSRYSFEVTQRNIKTASDHGSQRTRLTKLSVIYKEAVGFQLHR